MYAGSVAVGSLSVDGHARQRSAMRAFAAFERTSLILIFPFATVDQSVDASSQW